MAEGGTYGNKNCVCNIKKGNDCAYQEESCRKTFAQDGSDQWIDGCLTLFFQ